MDGLSFIIKKIVGVHKCFDILKNPEVSSSWIAEKLYSDIKSNPDIGTATMANLLKTKFSTATTRKRLYKDKRKALHIVKEDFKQSYKLLQDYAYVLL